MTYNDAIEINVNLSAGKSAEPTTDAELVAAVLDGNEEAFAEIFERYRRLVVYLVSRYFTRRETIEDLVQQTFTKVYVSLKSFRGGNEKSFNAWLSRLTINICYDESRRCQRQPENIFAELSIEDAVYIEKITGNGSFDSETAFVNRDLAEKLLSGLDAKDRLALTLYHAEEYSVAEVAEQIGWMESNVKVRLMRARNYLRNILEKFD